MRLLITGALGQLGRSLQQALEEHDILPIDLPEHDVAEPTIIGTIEDFQPDLVIHAAAMTDVDGCEVNPDTAYKVNALGTQNVALACQRCDAPLLYVSTDYVFDGTKGEPYLEFDEPNPIGVYGRSKLAGELIVRELLTRFYVVRTAWLYARGGKNFVTKILELAEEREELSVVTSEVGSPTYAPDLARAIARLIEYPLYGTYHLVNEGSCSRYEFARRILELAGKSRFPLHPAETYQRATRVPANAALRNFCAATQLG
ncbi:MAG: dTDP-4-dehydrorhamnose reductase, partial [Anaerolineae bacterium]|nr:dTDP-4-dehydrorhamnose reductase [Anaerolineae bacterium]NIN94646.1 dTDP-4-dehydrorhamnose reductase [Anaerolineae bacterium]NIQ77706.1 dTDP-4-dehydrorhamnose reductase [Anaerolineae bacterium]